MSIARISAMVFFASMLAMVPAIPALTAGTVVKVDLWDKGANSMDMLAQGLMLGMGEKDADMSKATMGITVDPQNVPAGEVTFEATNSSKDTVHEMVVAPVADPSVPLPYDKAQQKVDEDAAGHLGEVAELEPGQTGALTLILKPGEYILYCNIPGHYAVGMWTLITVRG